MIDDDTTQNMFDLLDRAEGKSLRRLRHHRPPNQKLPQWSRPVL